MKNAIDILEKTPKFVFALQVLKPPIEKVLEILKESLIEALKAPSLGTDKDNTDIAIMQKALEELETEEFKQYLKKRIFEC